MVAMFLPPPPLGLMMGSTCTHNGSYDTLTGQDRTAANMAASYSWLHHNVLSNWTQVHGKPRGGGHA